MRGGRIRLRWGIGVGLAVALAPAPGCTFLRKAAIYTGDRFVDAADMVDLGVTVSAKRSLSAYACGLGLFTVGGGTVDGYFVGIGGSRIGIFRHYHKAIGLVLYSYEEFGWGRFDRHDKTTLSRRHLGLIGWLFFRSDGECRGPT